jgi:two-component system, chemotaxis family, CheB/CheR fusion protein
LFGYLREHVLPELVRDAASREGELRIWSAGCSTGEEAYSLAIVVHELLKKSGSRVNARIFATDLDEDAVAFARQGIFPARALADLPRDVIDRYFMPLGDEYEIRKHIRSMLVFGVHDVARRAPFPRIDLVLCRNVLVYFTLPLQRRALEMFAFSLRNGGYLVLGKSETINQPGESFAPDQAALKVFRRVGNRSQVPQSRIRSVMPLPLSSSTPKNSQAAPRTQAVRAGQKADALGPARDEETVLYGLPFGVVVVNDAYDLQYINPEARRLFGIHATAVGQDFIHLIQRVDPIAIRRIIDRAAHSVEPHSEILTSDEATGDGLQRLEITCRSMNQGKESHFTLTAIEVTEREQFRSRLAAVETASTRLMQANEEVLSSNRELARTIQMLQDENEQLQVTSAEVQAATEEVETLNEELQASNEELETLNEELLSTIEELNTTNDDLEARSLELQGMAIAAENARHQLRGILDTVDDGIIVVDANGGIVLFSKVFNHSFGSDFDPETFLDADGKPIEKQQTPIARAARGETFSMTFKVEVSGSSMQEYQAVGRPMSLPGSHRLGVITIRPSRGRGVVAKEGPSVVGHNE